MVGTLASTPLTERLRRFREAHPAIDLRLRTALSPEVSALVLRGDVALGLLYGLDPDPHLVATKVHAEPMLLVGSPRHRLARRRQVEPAALAGERWITFPHRTDVVREPYLATLEQWLAAHGLGGAEILSWESHSFSRRLSAGPPETGRAA